MVPREREELCFGSICLLLDLEKLAVWPRKSNGAASLCMTTTAVLHNCTARVLRRLSW